MLAASQGLEEEEQLAASWELGEEEQLGTGQPSLGEEGEGGLAAGQGDQGPGGHESSQHQGQLVQWWGGQQQRDWGQGEVLGGAHQHEQGPWGGMVRSF